MKTQVFHPTLRTQADMIITPFHCISGIFNLGVYARVMHHLGLTVVDYSVFIFKPNFSIRSTRNHLQSDLE